MAVSIDALVSRWRTSRDAATTVALCDALYKAPSSALASEVGEAAQQAFASDAVVLVAIARMYTAAERFPEAQNLLVNAGKVAPRDAAVYRWLGEVLLRKGDAERAEKVLERAVQLGANDAETRIWLDRAQVFKPMQARGGSRVVAAEIARTSMPGGGTSRRPMESMSDAEPTEILPADLRAQLRKDSGLARDHLAATAPNPNAQNARRLDPSEESQTAILPAEIRAQMRREPASPMVSRAAAPAPIPQAPPSSPTNLRARPPAPNSYGAPPLDGPPRAPRGNPVTTGAERFDVPKSPVPAFATEVVREPPPYARSKPTPPVAAPPNGAKPVVPNPRDVLDALALAGVFEPEAAALRAVGAWDKPAPASRRRGSLTLVALLLLSVAGGMGGFAFVKHAREKQHDQAEVLLQKMEADLHASVPASLEPMEQTMSQVFELDSRSPRAALDWLRERGMRGLLVGGENITFEESIGRAKEVGVKDSEVAFARLASFLYQRDTAGAAGLLSKWDGPAADDAWYQLLAGETLERAGDGRAVERYIQAQKLDSQLLVAQIALVRVIALEGDPVRGMELAKEFRTRFPDRVEGSALVALAWGKQIVRPDPAPPELDDVQRRAGDLPLSLAAVPHAVVALRAIAKRAATAPEAAAAETKLVEEARVAIQKGLVASDGPGMAAWFGELALELGDEQLARKAALTAVQFSASYTPARVLAARVALLGERLDEAAKATEDLDATTGEVAVVRAATAYERGDADALQRALDGLSESARKMPFLAAVSIAPDVLAGKALAMLERAAEIAASDAPWGDMIGMDVALDAGDVETAAKIAAPWGDGGGHPSRLVRLSRLARSQEKLDVAEAMSQAALAQGTVTLRAVSERVMVMVARGRVNEVGTVLARYPAVLGPLSTWLSAYATATAGKTEDARGRTSSIDLPPLQAPLPARLIAAASLGAMHDRKRGPDYVKDLLAEGVESVEVTQAALALGFKKVERKGKRPTFEKP